MKPSFLFFLTSNPTSYGILFLCLCILSLPLSSLLLRGVSDVRAWFRACAVFLRPFACALLLFRETLAGHSFPFASPLIDPLPASLTPCLLCACACACLYITSLFVLWCVCVASAFLCHAPSKPKRTTGISLFPLSRSPLHPLSCFPCACVSDDTASLIVHWHSPEHHSASAPSSLPHPPFSPSKSNFYNQKERLRKR